MKLNTTFLFRCRFLLSLIFTFSNLSGVPHLLSQTPLPPNGVELSPGLFIDKSEITNINWLEYLYYLNKDSSSLHYQQALPDTNVWLTSGDTIRWKHYLRYSGYRQYPVVGISYQQAVNYCRWRSAVVNDRLKKENTGITFEYHFRLPSEKEWMEAAYGNLNPTEFPFGYKNIHGENSLKIKEAKHYYRKVNTTISYKDFRNELKLFLAEEKEPVFNLMKKFRNYFPYGAYAPLDTFDKKVPENTIGLHHMIGNVSEMIIESGISKGGSWYHFMEESDIQSRQFYNSPASWLGFRCVCEKVTPAD